jgi:hypothetical protein
MHPAANLSGFYQYSRVLDRKCGMVKQRQRYKFARKPLNSLHFISGDRERNTALPIRSLHHRKSINHGEHDLMADFKFS